MGDLEAARRCDIRCGPRTPSVCGTNRGPVCTEGTHRGPLAHTGRDVCAQNNKLRLGRHSSRKNRAHIGPVVYHFRVGVRSFLVHIGYPMCYPSVCSAESTSLSSLPQNIHRKSFVERRDDGTMIPSAAVLLACYGLMLLRVIHCVSTKFFVIDIEF
jgi:hypothetical protein